MPPRRRSAAPPANPWTHLDAQGRHLPGVIAEAPLADDGSKRRSARRPRRLRILRGARRTLESAEEFDSSRFFLEALLATTTYETFLGLMMTEARRVKDKRDAKLDTIDEDEEKSGHK